MICQEKTIQLHLRQLKENHLKPLKYLGIFLCIFAMTFHSGYSFADETKLPCEPLDKTCLLKHLEATSDSIDNKTWRDQIYRETAKLLAQEKEIDWALSLLKKIENPDTKALTIRGIGMLAAETDLSGAEFDELFKALRAKAEQIEHPPSYAIALTYIATAQAFAGDDAGALKTALDMKNDALRNKALAEAAEIQAERSELGFALESISHIDSPAFKDKAHKLISEIFAKQKKYDQALKASEKIKNPHQKAEAVLVILAQQISPEEVSLIE